MPFKKCSMCETLWQTREEFLCDPEIELIGYQVDFRELVAGFLLFNHTCGTTLSLRVESFRDLYDGPVFSERRTGQDECPEYCLHSDELRPCSLGCECAFVREIIQIIRNRDTITHTPHRIR